MDENIPNGSVGDQEENGSGIVHPDAPFPDRDELVAYHLARGATREEAGRVAGCCKIPVQLDVGRPGPIPGEIDLQRLDLNGGGRFAAGLDQSPFADQVFETDGPLHRSSPAA